MTTHQSAATIFYNDTLARVQAWVTATKNALTSIGMVQTTDTGQLDINAVTTHATALGYVYGYHMFRFNDALQSTAPVFVKLRYGNGTASWPYSRILMSCGIATDGAGNFTAGNGTGEWDTGQTSITASHTPQVYAAGGADWAWLATPVNTVSATPSAQSHVGGFVLERTRNVDGAANGNGLYVIYLNSNGLAHYVFHYGHPTAKIGGAIAGTACLMGGQRFGTGAVGADVYFWPHRTYLPQPQGQSLAVMNAYGAEHGNLGSVFDIPRYDALTHRYLSLGPSAGFIGSANTYSSDHRALLRWE